MLNKLLKRCMPWMDKGRWYKIVLNPDVDHNTFVIGAGTDPAFRNVDINYTHDTSGHYTSIDLNGANVALIDVKTKIFVPNLLFSYVSPDLNSGPSGTTIIYHDPISILPSYGFSIEILAFGR